MWVWSAVSRFVPIIVGKRYGRWDRSSRQQARGDKRQGEGSGYWITCILLFPDPTATLNFLQMVLGIPSSISSSLPQLFAVRFLSLQTTTALQLTKIEELRHSVIIVHFLRIPIMSFPGGSGGKEYACSVWKTWVGKIPWSRAWQPTPVSCLENPHGQRSLASLVLWLWRMPFICGDVCQNLQEWNIMSATSDF